MGTRIACIISVIIMISVSITSGCLKEDDDKKEPISYEAKFVGVNDVVNSSNEFSFDMYRQLISGSDNVFFSPYSIAIALGMAYEGARGETAEEMLDVINLPDDDQSRREMMRSLQTLLNPGNAPYDLSTANSYWLRIGEALNDSYRSTIENDYRAHGQQLNFAGDPSGSADTINNWVESETNGKIKNLISPSMITPLTYLILTNAIYFKSDWKWQFDPEATEEDEYHLSNGGKVTADMMNMCDEELDHNYAENDEVQILQLPYKGEALSMYILLPRENDISSLENDLNNEYLDDLKSRMYGEWMDIYLPRFKFEDKYDLNEYLKDMGMEKAFDPERADFGGIKESGKSQLYISKVIHQSFVEVNEEGTEAAAATAVIEEEGASLFGDSEPEPVVFRADHPFIFLIEHKETGQILLMGKVEDPSA